VEKDELGASGLGRCLTHLIRRWRFPPMEELGPVKVRFPFKFKPF
jgi:hypothetical protein